MIRKEWSGKIRARVQGLPGGKLCNAQLSGIHPPRCIVHWGSQVILSTVQTMEPLPSMLLIGQSSCYSLPSDCTGSSVKSTALPIVLFLTVCSLHDPPNPSNCLMKPPDPWFSAECIIRPARALNLRLFLRTLASLRLIK